MRYPQRIGDWLERKSEKGDKEELWRSWVRTKRTNPKGMEMGSGGGGELKQTGCSRTKGKSVETSTKDRKENEGLLPEYQPSVIALGFCRKKYYQLAESLAIEMG